MCRRARIAASRVRAFNEKLKPQVHWAVRREELAGWRSRSTLAGPFIAVIAWSSALNTRRSIRRAGLRQRWSGGISPIESLRDGAAGLPRGCSRRRQAGGRCTFLRQASRRLGEFLRRPAAGAAETPFSIPRLAQDADAMRESSPA